MKNTRLSLIAILLPALVFMGASLKVHAWPSAAPQVDVCVKNAVPKGYIGGGVNIANESWYLDATIGEKKHTIGPGVQKCEKFNKGQQVRVSLELKSKNPDGTWGYPGLWGTCYYNKTAPYTITQKYHC